MKVQDILEGKENKIITIGPDSTVLEAVKLANKHKIGSIIVLDDSELKGIISERDVMRECDEKSKLLNETKVKDVMTGNIIIALPEDDVQYIMSIMIKNKVRHIPIMEQGNVIGIISMGDIINALIE